MQNNQNKPAITLNYFTQPETLQQIGPARLNRFLGQFANDLSAAGSLILAPESENGNYFGAVGALFASTGLPIRLSEALRVLEEAASPENAERLNAAIQSRIPCVSINRQCPLDCALELWFAAPDELTQFQPEKDPEALPRPNGQSGSDGESSVRGNGCSGNSLSTINSATINHSSLPLTDPPTHPLPTAPSFAPVPSTLHSPFSTLHSVTPWPEPVNGKLLLDTLTLVLRRFVVLPIWAAEALALWILHTFAFRLRDVSTYIGIESPEKQCGKTTLLTVLNELAHRAIAASNISPPAFFRVIEDLCPTLLIDEGDTFLQGNEQLRGILNAGYKKKTGFVLRAGPLTAAATVTDTLMRPSHASRITHHISELQQSTNPVIHQSNQPDPNGQVSSFSCWCPKCIATIGRLPDTLADRCIVIRMQRKTRHEECERLRNLHAEPIKQQCARFVLDHQQQIAAARPEFPASLSDRACDIWEPLLALADRAGGDWPQKARQAAVSLTATAQETNPIGTLLLDIFLLFVMTGEKKMFTRALVQGLIAKFVDRPWADLCKGKAITNQWLAQQLRPYGIKPRTIWIGDQQAKGYAEEDFQDVFRRYIPRSELEAILAEARKPEPNNGADKPASSPGDNSLAA